MPDPHLEKDILGFLMRNKRMIEAYAYVILPDFHLVEDVFQEVACFIIENHATLPIADNEALALWLRQITRLKALEARRASRRMPRLLSEDVLECMAPVFSPGMIGENDDIADNRTILARCLEKLSGRARLVIEARYRDHLSCEEIASRGKWTVHSVYATLKRTKLVLYQCAERSIAAANG